MAGYGFLVLSLFSARICVGRGYFWNGFAMRKMRWKIVVFLYSMSPSSFSPGTHSSLSLQFFCRVVLFYSPSSSFASRLFSFLSLSLLMYRAPLDAFLWAVDKLLILANEGLPVLIFWCTFFAACLDCHFCVSHNNNIVCFGFWLSLLVF